MNYLRMFLAFWRVNIFGEAAYRINFFIQLFQSLLNLGMTLGGLAIIFNYTNLLGGWQPDEVLALVGVYFLISGIIGLLIRPGMEDFIESVRDGTFDFDLTKPVDAQVLVSMQRLDIFEIQNILLGLGVLIYSLLRLGADIGALQVAEFLLMLVTGGVVIYSYFMILSTLSFWFVRVENILEIFRSMYEAGRWPVSLYPGWLRYGLTFIVPIAFATTIPAEAITGRLNWQTLLLSVALAVVLFVFARVFWKIGLKHYSGASA
ncbi:MAG: ABC-2 family transporter protein [Dehalococcoidales bacterium]|nr:ABC-2 family transporter protein [Dehalococcoidales bacterium]